MILHPFLFATSDQLETARHNIDQHQWAARIYHQLKLNADELAEMELPVFETAWWQEAREKPWHDIYPEINLHTGSAVRPAMNRAFTSALVYRLGGDEVYAERSKRVLLHYTDYSFEFIHPDVGLNYSTWGIQALRTYDMLYNEFTPSEREKIDDFFDRMLNAVMDNHEWWKRDNLGGKFNNHYAWHNLTMAAYGLFYDKPEWVEQALYGEQGIRDLIEHGFMDDGTWFESSLNYHYTALGGLITFAWILRNADYPLDLFTHEFANGRTLEQGFSGMVQVLFPDLTIPQIGDTYGQTIYLPDAAAYEMAHIVYDAPLYAWLMSLRKAPLSMMSLFREREISDFSTPSVESRIFPEHGHTMLRSVEGPEYWHSDSWAAFLSYDLDSVHAHRDKLSLILFGRGKNLAPDANAVASAPHAFSARVARELNHTTVSHNTLMVDGASHAYVGEKLSLIEFKRLPGVKTATIGDLKGLVYPGVRMQRTVAVTDDYVLDVFQAASDQERTYDWLFHANDDEGRTRIAGDFVPFDLPDGPPWSWLRNGRSSKFDGDWSAEWRQADVRFRLTMLGVPGTEVILCDFPKNDEFEPPSIPMLMVRRQSKAETFVALYQAEKTDLPPASVSVREDAHEMLRIQVTAGESASEHLIPRLK